MRKAILLAAVLATALPLAAQQAEYDVVSVKPSREQSGNMMIDGKADGYSATGTTVKFMIMDAYGLKNWDLISGLPKWADDVRYDVETKMSPEMIEAAKKLTQKERDAQRRVMVKALLRDRFKLVAREEEKEMPVYALVEAKGGFKLKPLDGEAEKGGAKLPNGTRGGMLMNGRNSITGQHISMGALASSLNLTVHRQVIDRTGLTGNYDFTIRFQPEDAPSTGDSNDPSIFTALEEQLGLKLEATRAKIPSVVVEHVEQPGANE